MPPISASGTYFALAGSPPAVRARMLAAAARAASRRSPTARALARALTTTALGRIGAAESGWIERIEARRRDLESRQVEIRSGVGTADGRLPGWASGFAREIPLWGATMMVSVPPLWGRFLLRLVRELEPVAALELGTAFGISSLFQAAGMELNDRGRMLTLDAAGEWGAVAVEGFEALGLERRVALRVGELGETLAPAAAEIAPVDFAFVDAEHEGPATRDHFEAMLPHLADRAVVVFDDVWEPREMREAWGAIRRHERVGEALSLGRMGIVVLAP